MHACVTLIAFFRKSRRLHFHTKWVVVFFSFRFNCVLIKQAMLHEEFWTLSEWLVRQGHHQALEHR